jgi:hypothetical protein
MFTDEYVRTQHCDTASMLRTPQRSRASLTAPEVPEIDRLWRSITQAVKKLRIRGYHGLYPFLSAIKSRI